MVLVMKGPCCPVDLASIQRPAEKQATAQRNKPLSLRDGGGGGGAGGEHREACTMN